MKKGKAKWSFGRKSHAEKSRLPKMMHTSGMSQRSAAVAGLKPIRGQGACGSDTNPSKNNRSTTTAQQMACKNRVVSSVATHQPRLESPDFFESTDRAEYAAIDGLIQTHRKAKLFDGLDC